MHLFVYLFDYASNAVRSKLCSARYKYILDNVVEPVELNFNSCVSSGSDL